MTRRFLFLQGPHGPFFADLAGALRRAGAEVARALFNRGDRLFWRPGPNDAWFAGPDAEWRDWIGSQMKSQGVTDLVLYGDTRPVHAVAIEEAKTRGMAVHVFEEGYLRPWWVTYERGGANAHSPLTALSLDDIRAALSRPAAEPVEPPEGWGALYRHMAYGAAYHAAILSGGPRLASHRDTSVAREALLHCRRLVLLPAAALTRRRASRRLRRTGAPYHLVLLQLDHDASFRNHGPFPGTRAFLETVFHGFAAGAPAHHHLVLKAHPLEDGRVPLAPLIRDLAAEYDVSERTHFVPGGKLAPLLDAARTAITVNSTAAQQALLRGLPVKAFGDAVFTRPQFTSPQALPAFLADPCPPDRDAYAAFRQFLLETSQIPGSFYAARGRRQLCRRLPDMMLSHRDRYHRAAAAPATNAQHLAASPVGDGRNSG